MYVSSFEALGNKNLYYCDCAGFFENRGVEERFVAMISRNTIIKSCSRVRGIVFVCEYNSLAVSRGRSFIEGVLQVLRDLLSIDPVTLNKSDEEIDWSPFGSIFFCFSKVPDRVNKKKIVKDLEALEREKRQSNQYQSMCLAKILKYRNIFIIRPVNKKTNELNSKSKTKAKLLKKNNADKYLPKKILKFLGDAGDAEEFKTIVSFLINKTAIAFHELKEIPKMKAGFEGMIDEVNRSIITNEEAIKSLQDAEKERKDEYEKRKEELKEQRQEHTRVQAVKSIIQEKEKEEYKINLDILDLTHIKLRGLKISKKNYLLVKKASLIIS